MFSWYSDNKIITLPENVLEAPLNFNWAVWGFCFNRKILKDISFDETKKVGEDLDFMHKVFKQQLKCEKITKPLYYFTWENNEDSLSHKFNRGEL